MNTALSTPVADATPEQLAAIHQRGDVLLMAGAGTGKTRTLVERAVSWLLDSAAGGAVDRLLMVTFTDAAAAEMRRRIRERLERQREREPENPRIEEQLALLDAAHIQTLHSFCHALVRQHFYELGLDPQMILLDQGQAALLALETFDEMMRGHYEGDTGNSQQVRQLLQERARGWDVPLREVVFKIYAFLRSLRDPRGWLAAQQKFFADDEPRHWRELARRGFADWTVRWRGFMEERAADNPKAEELLGLLRACEHSREPEAMSRLTAQILAASQVWPNRQKTKLSKPLGKFFEEAEFWRSLAPQGDGPEPLAQDWQWTRQQMATLLGLVEEFDGAYAQAKRAQGLLDFADLEQFALRLLYDELRQPSALAFMWRQKFQLVFVDEYQDINEAQDAILTALAGQGAEANRFLVGDVKQSIYRFRLANPGIFQNLADSWSHPGAAGRVLPLSHNFRSHEAILDFVNGLFRGLMRREAGGVDYDARAELKFGDPQRRRTLSRADDPPERRRVELQLLVEKPNLRPDAADEDEDLSEGGEGNGLAERSRAEKEARLVARRLRELKEELLIWDAAQNARRPVKWRDMVVLLRSRKSRAEPFAREFARAGVPLTAARGGFFESLEITDLLSLLQILDNPLQDLPLLAVLRSPMAGFKLAELAQVRLARRDSRSRFWTALNRWHHTPDSRPANVAEIPGLAAKVGLFLERHRRWREMLRQGALSDCLETILAETHYAEWCQTQERGAQRLANVRRLVEMARQFDPLQRQGLFRFLKFVQAQVEAEIEAEVAPEPVENAVRLLTIHQSKGLEFPVVALAGLGTIINRQDVDRDIILDEQYGLCPKVRPPGLGRSYPSVAHWLAQRRQRRELWGEELRLLYVALTRAVEHLCLTGVVTEKHLGNLAAGIESKTPDPAALQGRCPLDWIIPRMAELAGDPQWLAKTEGTGLLLAWRLRDAADSVFLNAPETEAPAAEAGMPPPIPPAALEAVAQRLRWQYPYPAATREPAKASVTALRRRLSLEDEEIVPPLVFRSSAGFDRRRADGKLTAAEVGAAHHLFLQNVRLARTDTEEALRAEAEEMEKNGWLAESQKAALDFAALAHFWKSEAGALIRYRADAAHRELPFTARFSFADLRAAGLPASQGLPEDEFIVLQGVADLAVLLPEELWLLDFKTDRLTGPDALAARVAEYTPQVRLYALALSRIYRRPATRLWLHFLQARQTVTVNAAEPISF